MTKKSELNYPAIYRIINNVTGTVYIGQAENVGKRWGSHLRNLRLNRNSRNLHFQRAWNKYGEENFSFEVVVVFPDMSREELRIALYETELKVLEEYNHNCYNLMQAGVGGMVASAATKQKLSNHNKRQWQKEEHRAKISVAQKKAWAEPGRKEERIAKYKESFKKPEYKKRRKELSQQMWAPGGVLRETQSEKRKLNWKDPEYVAKQKESRKQTWLDPEIKARRIAGIRAGWARRKAVMDQKP